jgi:hypothetical protein
MANDNEIVGSGEFRKWVRCNVITIDNTYGKVPLMRMNRIMQTVYPDGVNREEFYDVLEKVYDNPMEEVMQVNPATDEPLGFTMTLQSLMLMLYSLYRKEANAKTEREAAEAEQKRLAAEVEEQRLREIAESNTGTYSMGVGGTGDIVDNG